MQRRGGGVQADSRDRTRAGGDGAGDTAGGREAGDGLDGAGGVGGREAKGELSLEAEKLEAS